MGKIVDMSSSKYLDGNCVIKIIGEYEEGTPALAAVDADGDDCVLTVSPAGYGIVPPEGHVFIKNYSENEGVLKPLVEAGVLSIQDSVQPRGSFVAFPLCKIEVELEELK